MTDRRDHSKPVTVINRFTVRGGDAELEKFSHEFHDHSQYLRRLPGLRFLVTVQLVYRPEVYVHLAHWRSLEDLLRVVHEDEFLGHAERLGQLVDAEADQAVSVGRTALADACVGATNVVLIRASVPGDHAAFERAFGELTAYCTGLGDFGGSDLLRSTIQPLSYFGLSWWHDTAACDRALHSDGYRSRVDDLRRLAHVTTERTRHIAYQRTLVSPDEAPDEDGTTPR